MIAILILQVFLFGITVNEWIEITQVPSSGRKHIVHSNNVPNTTFPSFDVTLKRPSERFGPNTMQIIRETTANRTVNLTEVVDGDDANIRLADADNTYEVLNKKSLKKVEYGEVDEENGQHVDDPPSFVDALQHIQNQLMGFKGRSLEDKVQHLEKVRDKMLQEIDYQISEWFSSSDNRESQSRLYKDSYFDNHQVDYPSNESALMTIGFLTFAVFLIKLVLKLIYALKMKQQYYYQTTTTPASIFLKKRQSEVDLGLRNQSNRIMQYLEEYSNV